MGAGAGKESSIVKFENKKYFNDKKSLVYIFKYILSKEKFKNIENDKTNQMYILFENNIFNRNKRDLTFENVSEVIKNVTDHVQQNDIADDIIKFLKAEIFTEKDIEKFLENVEEFLYVPKSIYVQKKIGIITEKDKQRIQKIIQDTVKDCFLLRKRLKYMLPCLYATEIAYYHNAKEKQKVTNKKRNSINI